MTDFGLRKKPQSDSASKTGKRPKRKSRSSVVCNECGSKFSISIESKIVNISEARLGWCEVKYVACPKCNKLGVISILDGKLCKMDRDIAQLLKKLRYLQSSGADRHMIEAVQNDLQSKNDTASKYEKHLMDKYKHRFKLHRSRYGKKLQFVPAQQLELKET